MKNMEPQTAHLAFRNDMIKVMRKHQHLPAIELLAIASNFVGQMIALQDQTQFTVTQVMQVVNLNIMQGNTDAMNELMNTKGEA